jgi:hypothetical protein
MRLFEFVGDNNLDRFTIILKNLIGRYASEKSPAKLNWQALTQLIQKNNLQLVTDYETFKAIYDANPQIQSMVKNFNADGIELNIPGESGLVLVVPGLVLNNAQVVSAFAGTTNVISISGYVNRIS